MVIQDITKSVQGCMNTKEDFEELYLKEEIPWEQDGNGERLKVYYRDSRLGISQLIDCIEGNVTEVGCGLGYALDFISWNKPGRKFRGIDISEEAIKRARARFPRLDFWVSDITKQRLADDIVILNECLWYVMHDFKAVLDNINSRYLIISQSYLEEQKYGRELIDGWMGVLGILQNRGYTILNAEYDIEGVPLKHGIVLCTKNLAN